MKQNLSTIAAAALLLLPAPALAATECDPGETEIRFSHVANSAMHPKGIAAEMLAGRINAEMDGRFCMTVHADASLYNDDEVLSALAAGDVELAAPSLSKLEGHTHAFRIFDIPFMFADMAAVERFQASPEGQDLLRSLEGHGLAGLAYWHNGMKQLSASRPLLEPEDAAGLRFRIQPSAVIAAQMQALGASAIDGIPLTQVRQALADGGVDGQENTWSNILGQRLFTVQDGITESNHGVVEYLVVAAQGWLAGLEPESRAQFLEILAQVTESGNRKAGEINRQARQQIIAAGATVRRLSDRQLEAWRQGMQPVQDRFADEIGADLIAKARAAR